MVLTMFCHHIALLQAHLGLKEYEMALADFKKVLDIEPENKAAKNQVIICQQKLKQQREEEHKRYGGMFEKFAEMDAKV